MTIQDCWLLTKKIAVGIAITVVPLAILAGGLWLTERATGTTDKNQASSTKVVSHAN